MTTAAVEETTLVDAQGSGEEATGEVEHLAKCADCGRSVRFTPTASGQGFQIRDGAAGTFGVGPHGRPICPDGHGEMEVADDQLPAGEAIEKVRQQLQGGPLEPLQGTLPGVFPVFNFEGCYMELEKKGLEVEQLRIDAERDKETAKGSQKRYEAARDLYLRMSLELRRRRLEKSNAAPEPEPRQPALVRCSYERDHQDMECAICRDPERAERDGFPVGARDSVTHAEEAAAYELYLFRAETQEALEEARVIVPGNTIHDWTQEQLDEAKTWAEQFVTTPEGEQPPERPAFMGRSHIAADIEGGEDVQCCRECGAKLLTYEADGDDNEWYAAGTLVGTDCPGPGQAYPKKRGKKKSAPAAE